MPERVDIAVVERLVSDQLNSIIDPCSQSQAFGIGLRDLGLIRGVALDPVADGRYDVEVEMRTTAPGCMFMATLEEAAHNAVADLDAVRDVRIAWNIGFDWSEADIEPEVRERLVQQRAKRRAEMRNAVHGAARRRESVAR
jgi:metal-sulfur cluster biosynthetic enzyme